VRWNWENGEERDHLDLGILCWVVTWTRCLQENASWRDIEENFFELYKMKPYIQSFYLCPHVVIRPIAILTL
jgi:hypothetical protein